MTRRREFGSELPGRVAQRLKGKLPGSAAQASFAPELGYGRHFGPPPWNARTAAVICALSPGPDGRWRIPLTVRAAHLKSHAGQVSFPGGETDAGESLEQAALREWREELGDDPSHLQILGRLSPLYVFNSNFLVTPCVAVTGSFAPQPNPEEVAEVIWLELETLFQDERHGRLRIERPPLSFHAPSIHCGPHQVWGATSMMLAELAAVLASLEEEPSERDGPTR